eukprot:TRINITY_DN57896_c0_g1_i1.p1 TRINITY_DN57896_c0_g1~~TRINITY_DN57896_c0_g1_i1.p1  ORF type:complete len:260 (+),score=75.25 TRINITY_DN57896_c0_g1_i1:74-853(+)
MAAALAGLLELATGSAFVPLQHHVQVPRNHIQNNRLPMPTLEQIPQASANTLQVSTCLALGMSFGVAVGLSSRNGGKVARHAFGWKTLKKWLQRGKKQEAPESKKQEVPEAKKQDALETKKQEAPESKKHEAPIAKAADEETASASTDADKALREAFNIFDKDKNGGIDKEELKSVMISLGHSPDAKELDDVMAQADTDGNGEIDFEEFRSLWGSLDDKKEASATQTSSTQPFWVDAYAKLMAFGDDLEQGWNDKYGKK